MNTDKTQQPVPLERRWCTIKQFVSRHPEYTGPAIRALWQKTRQHFNHRGEWVAGNGLADAFCQPGGKHGKLMIDEIAFARWLEGWAGQRVVSETKKVPA